MYLKKIQFFGFKSFADRTEILFEKGITAVVGPNGCGKSNISDGIRWVLGERSAKTLRGGKMEDVIFSGTQLRKPQGLAEVHLTIDNHDRGLPIAYDEVVISRKLYRSGESEYMINKTVCRMKDIQDLLLDTGIGSSAYSMIEQGKIDYILNAEEEERRFLIEEAAGISKYKVKKDEALRKLERTEANLLRIQDIVAEVEKNINYAERQARRAARYKEQFDRLKLLETQKAFLDITALENERTSIESQLGSLNEELHKYDAEIREKGGHLNSLQSKMTALEQEKAKVDQNKYEKLLALSEFNSRLHSNSEKKASLESENSELERDLALGGDKIRNYQHEISQKESESRTISEERDTWSKETEIVRSQYEDLSRIAKEEESRVSDLRSRIFELASEAAGKKNLRMECEIAVQRQDIRKEQAERIVERLGRDKISAGDKLSALTQNAVQTGTISEKSALKEDLVSSKHSLELQEHELREAVLAAQMKIHKGVSLLEMTETLAEEKYPAIRASESLLEICSRPGSAAAGLVVRLSEIMQIREGYENAIRTCLADWINALIVRDHDQAMTLADLAKSESLRGLLLILQPSDAPENVQLPDLSQIPGSLGFAADFVTMPPEHLALAANLFGTTLIVDRLSKEAIAQWTLFYPHLRIVSLDGFLLTPDHRMEYSGVPVQPEILAEPGATPDSIRIELPEWERELAALQLALSKNREDQTRMGSEIEILERELLEYQIQTDSAVRFKESLDNQLARIEEELSFYGTEICEALSESSRLQIEKAGLDAALEDITAREHEEQSQLEKLTASFNELLLRKEELSARVTEYTKRLERFNDQSRFLQESLAMLSANERSERDAQEKRKRRLDENQLTISRIAEELTQAAPLRADFERTIAEIDLQIAELNAQRLRHSDERDSLAQYVQELRTLHERQKENQHKYDLSKMEIAYKLQAIEERLLQTYQINLRTLDKANYARENVNRDELESEIGGLREKLDSIGTVNLLAVDEYESLKERFSFLSAQKQDLEKARDELLEAIRKINRTTKQLFEETFLAVKTAFAEYFRVLFAGGNAEMLLVDESNPLESGIEIMAKPPGKKLQRISLLSGGEKALTVIALLFALFRVKPSPFCVFDEVDAPLDESNVDRFLQVVRSFLPTTQFIMVTHNRKSIAAADILYGVTMEEAGVSKLVSVKLAETDTSGKEPQEAGIAEKSTVSNI